MLFTVHLSFMFVSGLLEDISLVSQLAVGRVFGALRWLAQKLAWRPAAATGGGGVTAAAGARRRPVKGKQRGGRVVATVPGSPRQAGSVAGRLPRSHTAGEFQVSRRWRH